jgi:hypothetical protein
MLTTAYLAEEEGSDPLTVSVWVVGDMDEDPAMDLATEAIQALVSFNQIREFSIAFAPITSSSSQ